MGNTTPGELPDGTDTPTAGAQENPGFLQEANGTYSSMRLMSCVALAAAIIFGLITLWIAYHDKQDGGNGIILTFGFLLSAFAPKVVQKFAEEKISPKKL